MDLKTVKRRVDGLARRLGLWTNPRQPRSVGRDGDGAEMDASWYDRAYASSAAYQCHYSQSPYYFSWCVIADRILRDGCRRVLEIGCGSGQFAAMLSDQGISEYVGLDFSPTAIEMAQQNARRYAFVVDDARTSEIYDQFDYDVIVCTEVLEHIQDDLAVVSRFVPGKRCICTVPSFPYTSHVRHFRSVAEVDARYRPFFDKLHMLTLKGVQSPGDEFFLFDGVRNSALASQGPVPAP